MIRCKCVIMCGMSIKPITSFANRTIDRIVRAIPSATIKDGKIMNALKWTGQHISSPENRLILGVTALMSQPFIDLHNRNVDKKTKKVSAARTVAKIIAGNSTGYFVRWGCIKAIEAFTQNPAKGAKGIKTLFYPKHISNVTLKGLTKYKNAIGTLLALGVMLFTNFLIDAPLTKFLTNKFIKKMDLNGHKQYFERPTIDSFTKGTKEVANE